MNDASPPRDVLKLVRDLQRRKAREKRDLVILEGRRLVEDALGAGARFAAALAAEGAEVGAVLARARDAGAAVETVSRKDFESVADTEAPSGLLAVVEWAPRTLANLPPPTTAAVALVLDAVQDPGNVGTMIRTAHALGAWCTIALDGTADVRNPKVLRAAMGSHFRHPVATASFSEFISFATDRKLEVCVAAAGTGGPLPAPHGPLALVVGSEGHGVRDAWGKLAPRRVTIPMRGDAESLNASVATGILLYELARGG